MLLLRKIGDNSFSYDVSGGDNTGKEVVHAGRRLERHEDGSVELAGFDGWVNPEYRGNGISARLMMKEFALLRGLSKHPNTRRTLQAGQSGSFGDLNSQQKLGTYTWGNFGYDLSDNYGSDWKYQGKSQEMTLIREKFHKWVQKQVENKKIDLQLVDGLINVSESWQHSWEVSNLRIPGVKINCDIAGKSVPCDIGKAYLTSNLAPCWNGVWLVNRNDFPGRQVGLNYCKETIQKALNAAKAEKKKLSVDLFSNEKEVKLKALEVIATKGGDEWIRPLEIIFSDNANSPEIQKAVANAVRRLKKNDLEQDLLNIINDKTLSPGNRIETLLRLRTMTEKPYLEMFLKLLNEPNDELNIRALTDFYYQERNYNPELLAKESEKLLSKTEPGHNKELRSVLRNRLMAVMAFCGGDRYAAKIYKEAIRETELSQLKDIYSYLRSINTKEAMQYADILALY